jgi:CoA:oxalate CoA-transferase
VKVLEGVRILDLSRFLAGPLCGMLLADAGAEVIRIEPPGGGEDRAWALTGPDGENLPFKIFARNKKGITLSLRTPKGKAILEELIRQSDVVLHNVTPGTRLGEELSYLSLKEINSRIIVAAITGYGSNGPKAERVGLDYAIQAGTGGMVLNGPSGGPAVKTTVPYIDCSTGALCALGILFALYHRKETGVGQAVEVSLFDTGLFVTQALGTLMLYTVYGETRKHLENAGYSTFMTCLRAQDGMVMVVPSTNYIWKRFARAIGREDMISDTRFKSDMDRWANRSLIEPIVQDWASRKRVDEIIDIMGSARVACEVVRSAEQLMEDPQVAAREMIKWVDFPDLGRLPLPGTPVKLSAFPGEVVRSIAPRVGQHNQEVYGNLLNISPNELESLKEEAVI